MINLEPIKRRIEILEEIISEDFGSHDIKWLINGLTTIKKNLPKSEEEKLEEFMDFVRTNHKYYVAQEKCSEEVHEEEMRRLRKEYDELKTQI